MAHTAVEVTFVAAGACGPGSYPAEVDGRHAPPGPRGRRISACAYGERCASPTPYRRPGLRRVRRAPRSGVRRGRGGRGGRVGAGDRGAGRAAGEAWDLARRGRYLHAA